MFNIKNYINQTVIKEYANARVSLVVDSYQRQFVEKVHYHIPTAQPIPFNYSPNGLEIIDSIIEPLGIPHARIIDRSQSDMQTAYVMDFIDGIHCEDQPKAEYLYLAAERAGTIYRKSIENLSRLDQNIVLKYSMTHQRIKQFIQVIQKCHDVSGIDSAIDYIFIRFGDQPMFVNHHDLQFKNFVYNDNLHLIDWDCVQIHPFYSDLHALISQADQVNADVNEIKRRYMACSQIQKITDEEILIGGLIGELKSIFEFIIFDCPVEWLEDSLEELRVMISKMNIC